MLRKLSSIVLSASLLLGASGLSILPAGRALAAEPVQTQEVLLNGFENLAAWDANDSGVVRAADTQDKTQGAQSIGVTFPVPDPSGSQQWREFSWDTSASTIDLSDATELKVDIKPVGGTAPLHFKLINDANEGIYESAISIPNAGAWNTFELELSSIPAEKRAAVKKVIFYVYNKDGEIGGRTSLNFKFDNMRAVQPVTAAVPLSEKLVNGFDNAVDWPVNNSDMNAVADTVDKTEGSKSYNVIFPTPVASTERYREIHWNTTALPVDLSSAETIKFDLKPLGESTTGNQTTGDMEPLRFKLVNNDTAIYEDAIPTHTLNNGSNPWTVIPGENGWLTYSLDLTKVAGDRSAIKYFVFYVWLDDGNIAGRQSVQYKFDNLRVMTHEVQGVTATPDSSAVIAGTTVSLSTTTAGASIYYTTDGTDPRTSSSKSAYSTPIAINDSTQIKAYAEVAGSKSAVSTHQYSLGTGTPGEALFTLKNGVADTLDRMVAGLKKVEKVDQNGYVTDWSGQTGFKLPSDSKQVQKLIRWDGVDDLSADVSLAYDDANLYVHAKVKDDTQFDKAGGDIWLGDSVQMAFSADGYTYGPEYGFSYNGGSLSKFRWSSGSAKLDVDSVKLKVARDDSTKETTYDIVMPWLAALPAAPTGNVAFTMLVNDNDGGGRESFIEWTPGIGVTPKDATSMGSLSLLDATKPWAAALHGPNAGVTNTPYNYVLTLSNFGTEAADFAVSVPAADLDTHVSVPAGKVVKKTIPVAFENTGSQSVTATVTAGGVARTESIDVSIQQNGDELTAALDALNAKLPALEALFAQAKEQGIPVDYETVNLEVIKQFITYGKDDISYDYITRANYVAEELQKLYAEAETNLNAYLNGTKQAKAVPEYVSSRPTISGPSLVADTKTSVSSDITKRPVFFTGYGHFGQAQKDIPIFNNLGANIIQMEIGPNSTVMAPEANKDEEYSISTEAITNSVLPVLHNAEENNVAVSLLLSPHYFPGWALDKWTDLKNGNAGFLNYNINDPRARTVEEAFLRTIVPMVKDYKSLQSIVISNEPNYDTRTDSYAVGPWHDFLEDKYGDIAALNELYGTEYASFDDVTMPAGKQTSLPNYDWTVFNNKYFSDWHAWMAGIIHELAPDIPVSAKTMARIDDAVSYGINQEDFSKFTTLNGNDNWNFSSDTSSYMDENKYYDLQNSMRLAPVFNSETHIIADRDTDYSPQKAKHAETSLFQSAVHGKTASTIWVWERSYDTSKDFYGSVLERPDVVKAIGKVSLDLNRLAYEVTELQKIKPQAAILYSLPSLVYSSAYNTTLSDAYSALTLSGQKAGFVSEQQAKDGGLPAYKLLIVPQATNVSASTLTAIKAFVAGGGKVIIVGDGSLSKNENDQPLNADDRDAVMTASEVLADSSTIKPAVREALADLGLMKVVLKDKSTGAPVEGVEWQSTMYNDKLLIDVANYDSSSASKTVSIEVNGKPIGTVQELINGGTVDTGNFILEQEKPYLLSVDMGGTGGGPIVIPDQPNVIKNEVVTVSPKLANGMASGAVTADELKQALNESEKGSDGKQTAVVELQAVDGAEGYALQLPAAIFGGADSADRQVSVNTSQGTFLLPLSMFDAKDLEGVSTLELTIHEADSSGLGDNVKQAVEIGFKADGKALRWNNADAPVTITIPYAPTAEEQSHTDRMAIWYIDENGHAVPVPSGRYDTQSGSMMFQATHFSKYAVAYVTPAFTDIKTLAWAKSAIEAVTAKGIMTGTSASLFSPGASISRAAFTDALVKALGLSARFDTNFADVPSTSPYYESIGVARKLGIAIGSGKDAFTPNAPITRQEMAALVVRGLQASGRTVAAGTAADLKAFADAPQVAAYAVQNVASLVKSGILKGDGKNLLPKGQVTRAQTAVLMERLYNA